MEQNYNLKNPAVKRIMREAREMGADASSEYEAHPLEDNIFEWHFTVRGTEGTEFELGCYHGRILLPAEYPLKPPEIMFLTPNGRFELNTKVCLSVTNHHPEFWQPAWDIRTVILAIRGFFPTESQGAIGALEYSKEERRVLAKKSRSWVCPECNVGNNDSLGNKSSAPASHQKAIEDQSQTTYATEQGKTLDQSNSAQHDIGSNDHSAATPTEDHDQPLATTKTSTTPLIPTPYQPSPLQAVQLTRPPIWLDAMIGALLSIVAMLLVRQYFFK